jgi:outer membrane receptor protein involved in Fe transport
MKRLFLFIFAASTAYAQTPGTASVRGVVKDPAGITIAAADVTVDNAQTGLHRRTTTDAAGVFTFADLPLTGGYRLRIAKAGFATAEQRPLQLRGGETATIATTLRPVGVNADITVYGTAEGVRSDSPELGLRLDAAAVQRTPVIGRKITSLPLLHAAVRPARGTGDLFLNNTLFVVNGGGRRQTTYEIDSGTGDDAWGRQTIFTNVPLAAIQEFTVLTNAFSAEYGRTTGAAINLVTQSGTNAFHSDVLALYRPQSLQANAPVTDVKAGDELRQLSGMFSGPLVADRTHFLLAGEYNDQARQSRITSPLQPGTFTGVYHQWLGLVRLDQEIGDSNHAMLRGTFDRFSDTNPQDAVGGLNLPSAARTFKRRTAGLQLSDTATLSNAVVNDARVQWQSGSPITQFTPADPSTQYVRPGVSTEGESRSANLFNHQLQFADTASYAAGSNFVRFGGDVIRSHSGGNGQEFGAPFVLGQFTFKTAIPVATPTSALTINDVARYTQGFGNVTYTANDTIWSLFAQDDWHVRPSLTINAGLRYDRQTLTDDTNNLAPRLGFAWNLGPRTVVRGGYGIYYSQIRTNIVAGWAPNGPQGFFTFTAAPGQLGFPTSLQPLPAFPAGAVLPPRDVTIRPGRAAYYSQFFDVSKLRFYPDKLLNPRTQQETIGFEREIFAQWFLSTDLVYAHTTGIDRNLDANAPSVFVRTQPGQTRSAAAADATRPIAPIGNGYRRLLVTVNQGEAKYKGAQFNLRRTFRDRYGLLLSYTWSHTTNNVEPDAPGGDPNDVNLLGAEWADSLLDQRHRGVLSGWLRAPFEIVIGGVASAASARPFNAITGADNNGDTANADRPVIDGQVVARNAFRGSSIFSVDLFAERQFGPVSVRGEVFNVTNHTNVFGRNGVYGNDPAGTPLPTFGAPVGGVASVEPPREFQLSLRWRY